MSNTVTEETNSESRTRIFGYEVSIRSIAALLLVATLCALAVLHPEDFGEAFSLTVTSVISFYFGQKKSTP